MNLGQAFGIDKLRIWQLEDELAVRNIRIVATTTTAPAIEPGQGKQIVECPRDGRRGCDRGIGARIRVALPEGPPGLLVAELADRLPDLNRTSISAYLWMFKDVGHTGERGRYRYYRKAAT